MNKYIPLFCMFLCPLMGMAQQEHAEVEGKQEMKIYGGLSIALKENGVLDGNELNPDLPVKIGSPINFSIHSDIYFVLNSRVTIQTGFSLQRHKTQFVDESIRFGCDYDDNGNISTVEHSYISYSKRILFLGIPVSTKINLVGTKEKLYARLGLEYLFDINRSEHPIFKECDFDRPANFRINEEPKNKNNATAQIGLGYEFPIGTQYVFLEPTFAYNFRTTTLRYAEDYLTLDDEFEERFFQVGVLLGMYF